MQKYAFFFIQKRKKTAKHTLDANCLTTTYKRLINS